MLQISPSLNLRLFKNIAHVGSFQYFVFVFVFVFVLVDIGYEPKGIAPYIYIYTLTLEHWNFLRLCLCICLSVCICLCHCHPWGSVDSVCHQLSENIWFDRLAVIQKAEEVIWIFSANRRVDIKDALLLNRVPVVLCLAPPQTQRCQ